MTNTLRSRDAAIAAFQKWAEAFNAYVPPGVLMHTPVQIGGYNLSDDGAIVAFQVVIPGWAIYTVRGVLDSFLTLTPEEARARLLQHIKGVSGA